MAEVTISLDEFTSLLETAIKHELMVDAIFDAASLNYSSSGLYFSADSLDHTLKMVEHDTYTARLHELQAKKEEE